MHTLQRTYPILLLFCTCGVHADEPRWPIDRGPAPVVSSFTLNADSLKNVPQDFLDDAPACYLYSGTTHTLESDGTVAMTITEAIRLNTRRAIDEFGEYRSIAFVPAYEKVTLHTARVRKVNGRTEDLTPRNVHIRDVNTDHLVYDSSKQVVLSIPRLEVGDVVEVSWTTRGRHPEYGDQFFHRYSFGDEKYPVVRDEWTVRVPKSRELKHATINGDLPVAVSEVGEHRVYSWRVCDRPAPPAGDRKSKGDDARLQAACSTFASWNAVHDWEKKILAGRCNCPPEAQQLAADLTRNQPSAESKARVLAQWVRAHVRYLSRGEKHDYTPHAPTDVLRDRCGDCKDCANLLAVMLREAGLKAGVATLGPRGDGQVLESLPCPWGTHALAVVTIEGQDHWIDTTTDRIGWNVLPHDDCDRVCYVSDPTSWRLIRTPKSRPEHHRTESTTKLQITSNGDAVGERVLRYSGVAAWIKRSELADRAKAEQRMIIAADLNEMFPNCKMTQMKLEALNDFESPLVIRAEFVAPELFSGEGSLETKLGDMTFLTELVAASPNPERRSALDIGDPSEFICRFEIDLPPVFRFSPGLERESAKSRWCELDVKVVQNVNAPRKLQIDSHAVITASRVEADDLAEWRDFQDALQVTFRVPVQIKVTRDPADIPQLEKVCTKTPTDVRSTIALAELYLMERKLPDAKQLLEKARSASPDERKLWDLSLVATDQIEEQEQIYRSMVIRFPDDPKIAIEFSQNLIDQDRPGDARKILDPLTKHKQSAIRAAAFIELAHCCMAQEEPRKALRHLIKAEESDAASMTSDAWFLKGQIHESLLELKNAMDAYHHVLDAEEAADALEAAARVSMALDRKSDALDFWRRLAVAAEGDPEALARAADLAIRLGRVEDALDFAGRAFIGKDEMHPKAHRPLGLALWQRGQFDEAIKHLSMADSDADVLIALVQSQIALGRLADAELQIGRFAAIEPTKESRLTADWIKSLSARRSDSSPKVIAAGANDSRLITALDRVICAEALDTRGLWPSRTQQLLKEALNDKDPPPAAFGLRAVLRMRRGDLSSALKDAEHALARNPQDTNGLHVRGKVRLERGDKAGLRDIEQAALFSGRKNARMLHDLAWGYATLNRQAEALAVQKEAVSLRPDDSFIRDQLKDLEDLGRAHEKAPAKLGR